MIPTKSRRLAWGLAPAAALTAALFACKTSSPDAAPTTPSACDSCTDGQCTSASASCKANADCKSIADCVAATSPCTGARADDPLCDDDCYKVACANKFPAGVSLYKVLSQCQYGAQCGSCKSQCAVVTSNMKCTIGNLCDLAKPDPGDCKCNIFDGGADADAADAEADAEVTTDSGGCSTTPTCDLVSAADINAALGLDVDNPTPYSSQTGSITVTECQFSAVPHGTSPHGAIIRYQFPDDKAGFALGRSGFMNTADEPNLGDAAYSSTDFGQSTLVVLVGCVEFEISSAASLDNVKALAVEIIAKL